MIIIIGAASFGGLKLTFPLDKQFNRASEYKIGNFINRSITGFEV